MPDTRHDAPPCTVTTAFPTASEPEAFRGDTGQPCTLPGAWRDAKPVAVRQGRPQRRVTGIRPTLPDTLAASDAKRGQCRQDSATAGDRQAGSAVDRLDRNSPDTRHDARLASLAYTGCAFDWPGGCRRASRRKAWTTFAAVVNGAIQNAPVTTFDTTRQLYKMRRSIKPQ